MPASTRTRSTVKNEKLAQRLSDILARLHQGEALEKHQLVAQYQVQVRTIERDLGERLCGIAVRCEDGLWRLTQAARGTIPAHYLSEYQRLAGTERLFPDPSLRYLLEQLETPPPQRSTQVQPLPHEDLGARSPLFTQLQNAIEARHVCHFTYKAKPRQVQPYRLIHRGGVWYLAAEEAGRLKNFSVALLEDLQVDTAHTFTPQRAHLDYIANKDDVWFTEQTTEVLLRVAPEIAHYFARRQLLPEMRRVGSGSDIQFQLLSHYPPLLSDPQSDFARWLAQWCGSDRFSTVAFGTEGGLFDEMGVATLVCGPGSMAQGHKADEYISIDQTERCMAMLGQLCAWMRADPSDSLR